MHRFLWWIAASSTAAASVVSSVPPAFAQQDLARQQLIARGEQLFFNETFGGNGRTCGTCHPREHNFTIDAEFIATLPPDNPLFVAEFNPNLAQLENPQLMREQGLILENLDGFDRPGVMRGVPHTMGLLQSVTPDGDADSDQVFGDGTSPANATGWGADGSPESGSLRDFAIGAVMQHFPQTLARIEGQDFRLPTPEELDALEAFQLSLGRQIELDLEAMTFNDAAAERGKQLFLGNGTNRACSFCHGDAGANVQQADDVTGEVAVFNDNFDTGTRNLDPNEPPDAGFGQDAQGIPNFGNGTFNTPSLIEAADTPPFFHNSSRQTLEEAIQFYRSDTFGGSPAGQNGGAFQLGDEDVADIAAFLRALNARDNALMAATDVEITLQQRGEGSLLPGALANAQDGLEVLQASNINPEGQSRFTDAITLLSSGATDANTLVLADLFLRAAAQNVAPDIEGQTVEQEIQSRRNPQPLAPAEVPGEVPVAAAK